MNDTLLSSIISGGTSLLGSLLGGIGKSKARKEMLAGTKPTTPYYETFKTLPILQALLDKSLLGAMSSQLGSDTLSSWGINPTDMVNQLTKGSPAMAMFYSPLTNKYRSK